MRIFESLRTKMCPFSTEVSFTTSVYFVFSMSAVKLRKSAAALSIVARTASVVAWAPCAAGLRCGAAERAATHGNDASASAAASQIFGFKVSTWGRLLADVFRETDRST